MPKKLSRKLAGCFAIELLFAAGLLAADSDYQAGTAAAGKVKALALVDRRGARAVFATAEFRISQSVSDFIAAQLMKAYGVDRAGLLLHSIGQGEPAPGDAVTAIGAALGALEPAVVRSSGGAVSITAPDGRCRATLAADGALAFDGCGAGEPVRAPIRAAFQMVDPAHGLQSRGEPVRPGSVQAIALGGQFVVLAVEGARDDARVAAAIRQVLARVGRR
jgi:pimeloyl-ACP methyl ester carboxylesterase